MNRCRSLASALVSLLVVLALVVGCTPAAAPSPTTVPKPAAPVAAPTAAPAAPALTAAAPAAAPAPSVIKIGGLFAMTGSGAYYGKVMSQGARLAVDELNAKGGVEGAKIELVIEDHKAQAKDGAAGMQKLADVDKVPFVLTSFSSPTLAAYPIAAEKKILMLNGGAWSPDLVNKPYLFNNRVIGNYLGQAIAEFAAKDLGVKKMAMLYRNDVSGISLRDYVKPLWTKLGGTVVGEEMHELGATDYTTQLAKLKQASPDVLALWSYGKDLGFIVKQARELGMTIPIVGFDWTTDAQTIAGATMNGLTYANDALDPDSKEEVTAQFLKAYKAKFNEDPDFYSANYYDAVTMFADLLKAAKAKGGNWVSGEALQTALLAKKKFPTVYGGELVFREDGTSTKPVIIFEIKDQKPVKKKVVTLQ